MRKSKELIDEIIEKYGEDVIIKEYPDGHPVIPTGSLALDVSTGIGGIPASRYTEIYGPESGGKTSLCLNICKQALKLGLSVSYVDVENSLDYSYALSILAEEYDKSRMLITQPGSAEESFEIAEASLKANINCVVFDSIASLSPEDEMQEDDYRKKFVGLSPRLTSQFLRKTRHLIQQTGAVFIFTNQVRASIGTYMGGYSTPAGYALKHHASLRVYVSKGKSIEQGDSKIGNYVDFVIKKNKLSIPFKQAESVLVYGKGIDYHWDILNFAVFLGIIKMRGSYYAFEDSTIAQGTEKTLEFLRNSPETLDKIVKMCYNIVGANYPPVYLGKE